MADHDHSSADIECPCHVAGWKAGYRAGEQSGREDLLDRYPQVREAEAGLGEGDATMVKAEYDPILGKVDW
jgi:hypothetical protein